MKVFISSVISGMEEFREAAAVAVKSLRHEALRAEDFPASSSTPQVACLKGVREADLTLLLLGKRYGDPQSAGLSATHEEYREARERGPVLVLIEEGVEPESAQRDFIEEAQNWSQGHYTQNFSDAESLRGAIIRALHEEELARARGPVSAEDLLQRARALLPVTPSGGAPQIIVSVTGGPRQAVLRPSEIEAKDLAENLLQNALFGQHRVLNPRDGNETRLEDHALQLMQTRSSVFLNEEGSVRIVMSLEDPEPRPIGLPVIIEEKVSSSILRALGYANDVLEKLDPTHRLTHMAVLVALVGAEYRPWRTQTEHARSPSSGEIAMHPSSEPVELSPPHRTRSAFRMNMRQIAEDLTILLRRQWKRP